jgi:hypothetical protein
MAAQSQSGICRATRLDNAGERADRRPGGNAAVAADSPPAVTGSEVAPMPVER